MASRSERLFARLARTETPRPGSPLLGTACVLGGSVAGLLTARVLANFACEVVVVESDEAGDVRRHGVAQYRQVHVLLPGGHAQIERWYPGFTEEMVELGAVTLRGSQITAYQDGLRSVAPPGAMNLTASRSLMEGHLRRRTLELPNVRWVTGRGEGLEFTGSVVSGVRYVAGGKSETISTDLVVDAMGRASRLGNWLSEAGWVRPPIRRVPSQVNYATASFRPGLGRTTVESAVVRVGPSQRESPVIAAAVSPIENGQWQVVLAGLGEQRPGHTNPAFVACCREDLPPLFGEAAAGEMVGPIYTYYQAESRRREFAETRLPARLVSVGDAVASFNPIYGQGLSSAALHASCLAEYLESTPDLDLPATAYFQLQRTVVDAAWLVSTAVDAARNGAGQRQVWGERRDRWLLRQVVTAASRQPRINSRLRTVAVMLAHPDCLFRPSLLIVALLTNAVTIAKRITLGRRPARS
jgi:2-polyprenyl-6-methoxyphenol hydroxylase-like FAD-dependent oxidoreductase